MIKQTTSVVHVGQVFSTSQLYQGVELYQQPPELDISDIVKSVKKELGVIDNPLRKCIYCGQWGAVHCDCPKCGAPIDPE